MHETILSLKPSVKLTKDFKDFRRMTLPRFSFVQTSARDAIRCRCLEPAMASRPHSRPRGSSKSREPKGVNWIAFQNSRGMHEELLGEILGLEEDPLPEGHILLRGTRDYYRIKAGGGRYRIIYKLLPRQRRVLIVNVRPREWAYSGYTKHRR